MKAKYIALIIVIGMLILSLSWLLTCGTIWCICALLQLQFTWKVASAIWLILLLISGVIGHR